MAHAAESRRLYSWWWDSHISPKNSKWLQQNLSDMDVKIKSMIKLIEEDADSFRKRAEMYYRKRPELLKLVEEFYRAYRALAERYDHATGALRQAHRTMAAAFPDQVPLMSPAEPSSADHAEPRTPAALPNDNPLFDDFKFVDVQLLLQENRSLRNQLAHESGKIASLRGTISTLESENTLSQETICSLEAGVSQINLDLKKLDDDRCHELQDEISLLEGSKRELENDAGGMHVEELEQRHNNELTDEQIGAVEEESCESLKDGIISQHISEKAALISQIEAVACDMKDLSEKNGLLESSLCDVNVQLEGLRGKLIALEESCQSLHCQNSGLLAEKSFLVTQIENISRSVENLNRKYAELESKNSSMETEKDRIHHRVRDLQQSLRAQKEEHETCTKYSRSHLESLEDQIRMLQERGDGSRREELEAEHHKIVHAQIEIFVMQRILRDMKENDVLCLDNRHQRYLEICRCQEELISELKRESLRRQKTVKLLSQYNEKLLKGIHEVMRSLDISEQCPSPDALHFDLLLLKIEGLKTCISDAQDDNQRLILDLTKLQSELLTLQSEKHRMLELNQRLREDMQACKDRERVMKAEIEILHRELSDLHEAHLVSQSDIVKLTEVKMLLEEDNSALVAESMKLESLYLIFRSYYWERTHELQLASYNVDRLLEECRRRVVILEDEVEMSSQTYQAKMQGLLTKCERLETFDEEIARRDAYEDKMKEKVDALDDENRGLKEELSAYLPLIFSLRGFVSSLEQHIFPLATHHIHRKQDRRQSMSNASAFGSFELQKLHTTVSALEDRVIGILSLLEHNKYVSKTALRAPRRDSEGSKSKGTADLEEEEEEEEEASIGKDIILHLEKCNAEICEDESEQIVKDIQLDHVISPSWYDSGSIHNHGAKDQAMEDKVMELWETMDSNKMAKPSPVSSGRYLACHQIEAVEIKNTESISERLTSDAQRLSALQTSAKQLKTDMQASALSDAPISFECKKIKAQLIVVEAAISRLIDTNSKLTEKADKLSSTSGSPVGEQKISERARRGSEKIGRLELELQKLEYIWLKLKEEHDYRRARAADRRTRVLLRDYFYGQLESPRGERVHCCACIRPRTKDE